MDGRSISVCEDWLNFNNFYNWAIKNGYDENVKYGDCTIDRIDVNGNYEPSNCRWVNEKIQQNNRTNNSVFVYNEDKYTIAQLSEISKKHGIIISQPMLPRECISARIYSGSRSS